MMMMMSMRHPLTAFVGKGQGSPPYSAETGSSSYGPTIRFRLLPTPPHDDAVTFSYGAVANSGRDFHPADGTPSRAYTKAGRPRYNNLQRGQCRSAAGISYGAVGRLAHLKIVQGPIAGWSWPRQECRER